MGTRVIRLFICRARPSSSQVAARQGSAQGRPFDQTRWSVYVAWRRPFAVDARSLQGGGNDLVPLPVAWRSCRKRAPPSSEDAKPSIARQSAGRLRSRARSAVHGLAPAPATESTQPVPSLPGCPQDVQAQPHRQGPPVQHFDVIESARWSSRGPRLRSGSFRKGAWFPPFCASFARLEVSGVLPKALGCGRSA